jgi:hypothetical protein
MSQSEGKKKKQMKTKDENKKASKMKTKDENSDEDQG